MKPPAPTHVGPYRLLHLLGEGGMGQVYAAVHETMGQQVALKLLSPDPEDPQRGARFRQEARVLAKLDQLKHPGVVRVFHYDQVGGTAFLAMELLQGLSLRDWMQRHAGPAPLPAALAVCRQIADVMADVHARDIVHRDLKPENVFLCPDEAVAPGYRVKLLDFGIAKLPPGAEGEALTTQVHTHDSVPIGTYQYMAPEQFTSAATVGSGADVYSLGVLLFELLAGRRPFVSEAHFEVISAHVNTEPPSLKQFVPALPGALAAFVASMLAKDPAERPTMPRCRDMLGRAWEREQDVCPVPGLAPFTEVQAELFFGRKTETQALLAMLEEARTGSRRWVQVEGLSGVGKSSLIQAGLLPRLKESGQTQSPRWLIATLRPSYEPVRNLARALAAVFSSTGAGASPEAVEQRLREGPEALRRYVTAQTPQDCLLLLVLEPMEELFTLGAAESRLVDALFAAALAAPDCPLRLLTSLRSDFLHRLEQLPALARQLHAAARFPLLPMDDAALAQVVQGMARGAGLRLSGGLADQMVMDARSEGGQLPLLGHALRGLWSQSAGALLTHADYERLGGVGGALARQAESLLDSLGAEGRERAKRLLLGLVQVGRGGPDTRRPRSRQELVAEAGNDDLTEQVLLRLTGLHSVTGSMEEQGLRLIMPSGGTDRSQQRVELMHETLLQKVPSLAGWLEENRPLLERLAALDIAAQSWEQAGCPEEGLPTGTLLTHYRGALKLQHQDSPSGPRGSSRVARFLEAARRLERRRAWSRWGVRAVAVMAGMAILFYAVLANQERRRAEAEQQRAETERQRAETERQRAESNLRELIETVDTFVRTSDWRLNRLPYTLEERRNLLRGFHKALNALPEEEHQRRDVRLASIRVAHKLGDVAYYNGTLAEADTWLRGALSILRLGLAQQPADKEFLEELGLNHSKRGKVAMAHGHWEAARTEFNQALRLLPPPDSLTGTDEDMQNLRRTFAVSLSELAELELLASNLKGSADLFAEASRLHEQNRGTYNNTYNEALLALTLGFRGEVAHKAGDPATAARHVERALGLARSCIEAHAGDQFYQWVLARVLLMHGVLQSERGQFTAAARSFREVQSLGKKLLEGERPNKRFALALAHALREHEALARRLGERSEANRLHDEVRELVQGFRARDEKDVRFQILGDPGAAR